MYGGPEGQYAAQSRYCLEPLVHVFEQHPAADTQCKRIPASTSNHHAHVTGASEANRATPAVAEASDATCIIYVHTHTPAQNIISMFV